MSLTNPRRPLIEVASTRPDQDREGPAGVLFPRYDTSAYRRGTAASEPDPSGVTPRANWSEPVPQGADVYGR